MRGLARRALIICRFLRVSQRPFESPKLGIPRVALAHESFNFGGALGQEELRACQARSHLTRTLICLPIRSGERRFQMRNALAKARNLFVARLEQPSRDVALA